MLFILFTVLSSLAFTPSRFEAHGSSSIQLSQVSALVNLTNISLPFGIVDAFKCLEKETKTTKNTVQGKFRLCTVLKSVHEPIRVREKSLTARFVTDADADEYTERIYGCLSIFYHCFDFHVH